MALHETNKYEDHDACNAFFPPGLLRVCLRWPERESRPQTQMVNAADLKPNEIQLERLSEEQLRRIKKLHETFAEVDSSSLEKWIDNFKRDANPDSEIAIWERVANAYDNYCSPRQLTLEAKGDVFQALVLRSMTSDEEAVKTLKLKVLSADEARKIMREY